MGESGGAGNPLSAAGMTHRLYPIEWSNRNFDVDVERKAEQVLSTLEEKLRARFGDIPFFMQETVMARKVDKQGKLIQPMKVRVSVGPTTAVSIDLGIVKGDYAEGIDFLPFAFFDREIDRIAKKIAWDLRIAM